jgi:hypothetical protein
MTITFENDNDVIVYALENIISYARRIQLIFAEQRVWWLPSVIALEQGVVIHIDNIQSRAKVVVPSDGNWVGSEKVHPDRVHQISDECTVWAISSDPTEERQANKILERAKNFLDQSERAENTWQRSRDNPLPSIKKQLKKTRKIMRLQEAGKKREAEQNQRFSEIRAAVIQNPSEE